MITLLELYNTPGRLGHSDKGTAHSYIEWYSKNFAPYQHTAKHILEIGVWFGDSINLWRNYFTSATIYGMDVNPQLRPDELQEFLNNNCIIRQRLDAYTQDAINWLLEQTNGEKLDILIDDGSHLEEHQIWLLNHYGPIMKEGGLMVIEDIQLMNKMGAADMIEKLEDVVRSAQWPYKSYEIVDRRDVIGRYDDILFVVRF